MKQNYYVEEFEEYYIVVENSSDLVIEKFQDKREASRYCRNLNLGFGFEGSTPLFMSLGINPIKKAP